MIDKYQFRRQVTYEGIKKDFKARSLEALLSAIANWKRDIDEGKQRITKHMLVRDWAKEYTSVYLTGSESTLKDQQSRLKNFILPEIGAMRLADVKSIHCQVVMNRLTGYSKDRAKKVFHTLAKMFEKAMENGLLRENPTKGVELPNVKPDGSHRPLTDYERNILFLTAEKHYAGSWVLTMLYSGLRPQETAALMGQDVDLKRRVLHVRQALKKDGAIGSTKSPAGVRDIPISSALFDVLSKLDIKPFEPVFKNQTGGRLSGTNMVKMWNFFKREMQIEAGCQVYRNALVGPMPIKDDLVPYCLRHTFCTDLQDAGISINIAKELMGHEDIKTTSKIYTSFTVESFHSARVAMDAFNSRKQESRPETSDQHVENRTFV